MQKVVSKFMINPPKNMQRYMYDDEQGFKAYKICRTSNIDSWISTH